MQPGEVARRNLTLVAKVLTKLGSGTTFKKEPYLNDMNPYILANIDTVAQFIERLGVRILVLVAFRCMRASSLWLLCCCSIRLAV